MSTPFFRFYNLITFAVVIRQTDKFLTASAHIVTHDFDFPSILMILGRYNLGLGRASAIRATHCFVLLSFVSDTIITYLLDFVKPFRNDLTFS